MTKEENRRFVITFNPKKLENKKIYLMSTENRRINFTEKLERALIVQTEKEARDIVEFMCSAYIETLKYENSKGDLTSLPFHTKSEIPEGVNIHRVSIVESDETIKIDRALLTYIVERQGY